MYIVCLDVEGVLTPEIWINVAEKTGIEALRRTTRDEPDYDKLMNYRIDILKEKCITLYDIQEVISKMDLLDGTSEFIAWLKEKSDVILLSDTFTQFAKPLMKKMNYPTLFCNELIVDEKGMILGYKLRQKNGKKYAVAALKSMGFNVFAAGDSYNDVSMIKEADAGAFFRPPKSIEKEYPDIPVVQTHSELKEIISGYI